MAKASANVRAMSTGSAWVAAVGATAPTDPTAALAAGFAELGWLSETGIVEAFTDTTNDVRSVGGVLLRRIITGSELTFNFHIRERNKAVMSLFYPGSTDVTASSVSTVSIFTPVSDIRQFAFQLDDGAVHTRIVVPRGEITARGNVDYTNEEYDMTMSCYPASNGLLAVMLTDDPALA